MFLRVSLFASILSVTASGAFLQSSSADWYGIQIRSQEQAAMEAAEKKSAEMNLPRNVWFEDGELTGESKPNQSGETKPVVAVSNEVVTEVAVPAPAREIGPPVFDYVWKPTSSRVSATTESVAEETPVVVEETVSTEEATLEAEEVSVAAEESEIDVEVANDVDNLLNQNEDWFAPLPGAEEASQQLENVAFEEETHLADSLTYLDELRELEEKQTHWIQSSVVVAEQEIDPVFEVETTTIVTQPIYVSELEAMAARHETFGAEMQSIHSFASLSEGRLIAQAESKDGYNPPAAPESDDPMDQVESLFPPLSAISVTGTSTDPRETEITNYPKNLAAAHMETLIPGEYVMGPVVGVSAPSRYPLCFQHNPLYFEDPNLERCGVSHGCFTTTYSASRFLTRTVALPYLVVATPPKTCMATLGDCPTCASFDTDAYLREWKWNR